MRRALAALPTVGRRLAQARTAGLFITIAVLCAVFTALNGVFLSVSNVLTIGRNASEIGIIAIGMTIVMIVGEVDLSVGALYGLGGISAGLVAIHTGSVVLAILTPFAVGICAGVVNGVLVGYTGLNSFMVTLASMNVILGISLALTGGQYVDLLAGGLSQSVIGPLTFPGSGHIFGISTELLFYALLTVLGIAFLRLTVLGYHLFAVGSNPSAARVTGIHVAKTKIIAFVISGVLAAVVGLLALGFVGSIDPVAGSGTEFSVFAAAIIGGASLSGGRGSLLGALLGSLILAIVDDGLILAGVASTYQSLFIGLVIILAIGLDRWSNSGRRNVAR